MASKAKAIVITEDELIKMKMRANIIPSGTFFTILGDSSEDKATFLYKESQKRTDQWNDNVKDLKKRK
jgi:hypothetical protein